ncbi:MAG: hypothetical protein IJK42_01855 [Prevotella sp.]|nr:hypothetical protein [Prevotella sp.]
MKKVFYAFLSLMMCMFSSCQKDEDVVPEPQPEPKEPIVKYAEYETNDDYVDFGIGNFMIATKNLGAKCPEDTGDFFARVKRSQRRFILGIHTSCKPPHCIIKRMGFFSPKTMLQRLF